MGFKVSILATLLILDVCASTIAAAIDISSQVTEATVMAKQGKAEDALILLDDLSKTSPADPMLDLGYGMVYGQSGSSFSAKRSVAALQRFLDSQGTAISEDYKTTLDGFIEKLKKGQALDHDVKPAAQSSSQATGSLTVTSPKAGKVRIDGGQAFDIQAGQQLQWDGLTVGKHEIEVVAGDRNWKAIISVMEKTVATATVEFPPIAGDLMSVDLGGGERMEFVWIPPGKFTMGSALTEEGHRKDENQHEVTLSRGFWMGKYEVTPRQFQVVKKLPFNDSKKAGLDAPVTHVTWIDAIDFCAKMKVRVAMGAANGDASRLESNRLDARLPTEAEWEYACRAGTAGAYAGDVDKMGWYWSGKWTWAGDQLSVIGQKQPNAWGLYDMHGNVSEWCQDWYGDYDVMELTDPMGPASGMHRVQRGGSAAEEKIDCRSASRVQCNPLGGSPYIGFRVVLSLQ
jgi:formylglycine-generating enzyme required for sulfatase activity